MKWIKRIFLSIVVLLGLAVLALIATGNQQVLYGIGKTYLIGKSKPDIDDLHYFETRKIPADQPQPWVKSAQFGQVTPGANWLARFDSMETTALLVIHRDSLLFEGYYRDGSDTLRSNSFSMAKSFTAILIGVAVDEGYITSLDQPVSDFIPEFAEGKGAVLTIRHLLQMASGIPFGESYNSPFGFMAKAYYGKNLVEETMKYRVESEPGTKWAYEGGNTILLGMILERATGRTVSQYFFEKIWSCIGAESAAYWNIDKPGGLEKTYTGVYATAKDFARIGKLWMGGGVWENDTLVSPSFVAESVRPCNIPDENGEPCTWYGLHWWIGSHKGHEMFSCRGLRGQYIICIPSLELLVVRTGHQQSKERVDHMPTDLFWYTDAAMEMINE